MLILLSMTGSNMAESYDVGSIIDGSGSKVPIGMKWVGQYLRGVKSRPEALCWRSSPGSHRGQLVLDRSMKEKAGSQGYQSVRLRQYDTSKRVPG